MVSETAKRRVLITGAGGRIGSHLAIALRDRYSLRLQYNQTMPEEPPVGDWVRADIAEYDQIAAAMEGIDAVIHMAGEPSPFASWEEVHAANIIGTRNVYEAARMAGVRKVILASTNHVMGFYDRDGEWPVYVSQPVRPDSLYGVSKIYGEAIARFYLERHGIRSFCLRIGACRADDDPTSEKILTQSPAHVELRTPEERRIRMRAGWLSRRDCAQLVARCLDADHLDWAVVYGISNNPRQFWDISHARELLGYAPEDAAPV